MSEDIVPTDIVSSAANSFAGKVVSALSSSLKPFPTRKRPRPSVIKATASNSGIKPRARSRNAIMSDGETDRKRHKLNYDRTPVACTNCRHRKIRCIPTDDGEGTECANCRRLHKECIFVPVKHTETETSVRTKKTSKKSKNKTEDETTSSVTNDAAVSSPNEIESYVDHHVDHFNNFTAMQTNQPSEDPTSQHSPQGHSVYSHYVHHPAHAGPMQWEQPEHAHHYANMPTNVTVPENPVGIPYGTLATTMDYASYSNSAYSTSASAPHAWPQTPHGMQYNMGQAHYYPSANAIPAAHQYHDMPQGPAYAPAFQPLYEAQASQEFSYMPMHDAADHATQATASPLPAWYAHQYAPTTDDSGRNPG